LSVRSHNSIHPRGQQHAQTPAALAQCRTQDTHANTSSANAQVCAPIS
jgi:hypothetical protein